MRTYKRKRLEHQVIEGVQELCRLCLDKTEEGIPIFKDSKDVCAAVAMRIMICVGLEMQYDDTLPNIICVNCHKELENCYKFRRKCEVSYNKLKSHILAQKYKEYKDVKIEIAVVDNKPEVESPSGKSTLQVISDENEQVLEQSAQQLSQPNETAVEKLLEMEEVQIPIHTEASPDIGKFLSTILTELGILVEHENGLVLQNQGINSFELETGNDEQLELELVEEDDQNELNQDFEIIYDNQKVQNCDGSEINEESILLTETKSKQKNRKGASKVSGPWCSRCGRVFSSRSAAARHARAHSGTRPHACPTCPRTFVQKSVRDRHMLVHLEVRPHACSKCGKSFTQAGALAAHARAHAPPSARPLALHRCTICEKVFLYASGLSRHMVTHEGRVFPCVSCDKQFRDRSSLLRHARQYHRDATKTPATSSGS